jgi:hypothetical protein
MTGTDIISAENVIAKIDALLLKQNKTHFQESINEGENFHEFMAILRMAEKLEMSMLKLVVTHVWQLMLVNAFLGIPFPSLSDPSKSQTQMGSEGVKSIRADSSNVEIPSLTDLWNTWKKYKAYKFLLEYNATAIRQANYEILSLLLKNFTTKEQYNKSDLQMREFYWKLEEYQKLSSLMRKFKKPPEPPEEPVELSLLMVSSRK